MPTIRTSTLLALLSAPLPVFAAPPGGGRPPPREAIQACAQQVQDDTCSFEGVDGTVAGVCMPGPRPDLPLACRPKKAEEGSTRRGPPPEAVEACEDLEEAAVCTFDQRDRAITGTCVANKSDGALACRPDAPPPRR